MNLLNFSFNGTLNQEPTILVSECVKYNSYLVDEMLRYKILVILLSLIILVKISVEIYKNKNKKE